MRNIPYACLLLLLVIFSGCSTSEKATKVQADTVAQEEPATLRKRSAEADYEGYNTSLERKVLFSAILHLTVKSPDTANIRIGEIADMYNGYVNEIGTQRTIIRVESKFLNSAISDISQLGKLESKNLQGQDVTDQFLDYHIRLQSAEKAREKYLELLEDAETVEEAVLVEKELERLIKTIESLKGKINRTEHLSEFSTITILLKEKKKPGILGYAALGMYYSVKWLFVRN